MVTLLRWCCAGVALVLTQRAVAQPQGLAPRQTVTFSIVQATTPGQSVFVLGDAPELGANVLANAVKLDPSAYPTWRVQVSLPAGTTYSYRYYLRSDGPGQTSNPSNGTPLGTGPITASTPPASNPAQSKVVLLTWDIANPVLWHRSSRAGGAFAALPMQRFGPGVVGRPNDTQWLAWNFAGPGQSIDIYFTDPQGNARYPSTGFYRTTLDGVFVQEGQLYSYVPSAMPAPARRDYNPAAVPTVFSPQLQETRGYRVFLPRGYDAHPARTYPVLYMHDGQNVFESGAFGSWNAAPTLTGLQARGEMREIIVVALDNGPNRLTDYLPPTDVLTGPGEGDDYLSFVRDTVKPLIDSQYRTQPAASVTGLLGSSMGGVISLYGVWDFTSTFTRGGLMSGAWQTCGQYLQRVRTTPPRSIRMYLDSGDAGAANDNYWPTYNLRDWFAGSVGAASAGAYALEGTVRHVVGFGQQHNEAAWANRLPSALTFLYPSQEEPNGILRDVFNAGLDVSMSGTISSEDLFRALALPSDLNLDGVIDASPAGPDRSLLVRTVRRLEREQLLRR